MTTPTTPEHGITPAVISEMTGGAVDEATPGLQAVIDSTVDAIRHHCGWHIWPVRDEVMVVDGEGGHVLTLPTLHVVDVIAVGEGSQLVDYDLYEWSQAGDIKRVDRCWTTRWRGITVELEHGYATIPLDLLGIITDSVADTSATPVTVPEQVGPFKFGGASTSGRWLSDQRTILDHYRLPSVA